MVRQYLRMQEKLCLVVANSLPSSAAYLVVRGCQRQIDIARIFEMLNLDTIMIDRDGQDKHLPWRI